MSYLEGLTRTEREEVVKLIDAEIQWYLEQFKRYEEDLGKDLRPGLKTSNPMPIEMCLRLIEPAFWDALPAWKQIVYAEVFDYSPAGKAIMSL